MATAVFAAMLGNFQQLMQLIPESCTRVGLLSHCILIRSLLKQEIQHQRL